MFFSPDFSFQRQNISLVLGIVPNSCFPKCITNFGFGISICPSPLSVFGTVILFLQKHFWVQKQNTMQRANSASILRLRKNPILLFKLFWISVFYLKLTSVNHFFFIFSKHFFLFSLGNPIFSILKHIGVQN